MILSDEADVTKEIILVWRNNVYEAQNGGEVKKMEELYDLLDRERENWNVRLNNPLTWGWGGGPDELNDWARHSSGGENNGTHHWGEHQHAHSDKTPEGMSGARNPENIPPSFLKFVSGYANTLKEGGRERSYAFAQVSCNGYLVSLLDRSDLVRFRSAVR